MKIGRWAALGLFALGLPAQAQLLFSCTVSASALSFGDYVFTNASPTDVAGNVNVTCTGLLGLAVSYDIRLSTGSSGNYAARAMTSGGNQLQYNLYATSPPASVWGDGSGATAIVQDNYLLLLGGVSRNYPVYGRVPAGQNVPAGLYGDTITVTVNYNGI